MRENLMIFRGRWVPNPKPMPAPFHDGTGKSSKTLLSSSIICWKEYLLGKDSGFHVRCPTLLAQLLLLSLDGEDFRVGAGVKKS